MAHRQRPSGGVPRAVFVALALALLPLTTAVPAVAGQVRITAVANATIRAMPDAGAEVVAQVPLGSEVADAGPAGLDKTWVRVRLADAREGWVLVSLTRRLDPDWRWPTYDAIIAGRLARKGDGFPAWTELVAFIERVLPEYTDPQGRARVELARLRALTAALESIPFTANWRREPYASWLAVREDQVVYDEPGGRWILAGGPIWELHSLNWATQVGDDIAWLAVTNGLPGECEGYLPCYLAIRNFLHGEYLRRAPDGRHAALAVDVVRETADRLSEPIDPRHAWQFDAKADCRDLTTSVDALAAAIAATRAPARDAALASLGTLRELCK
ncbi:MAG TPA: SH3 domain-containing protein [Vicinamibacterales bacterium]|nr:SH3 domain-containing protein [Vicinamibacterales bacterium]